MDTKDPELLNIPGAGKPIDFLKDLYSQNAPLQETPSAMKIPLQGVAGLGANEQTVQNLLAKYLGTTATGGEAFSAGLGEIKKTLGGEFYDPRTSDFWKGFRETSAMEQEQGVSDIRRRGQLGGGLFSTGVAGEEVKYQAGKESERTMMLGSLYEKERERKTTAVNQALGYAGLEEQGAANRINVGATVGAIPREIQDRQLQAAYNQKIGQIQENKATAQQTAENKYAEQLFTYTAQAGIAQNLMPQWLQSGDQEIDFGKIKQYISQFKGIANK